MGLGLVLVGHVNFLLGALVHGAVLRHINVHSQARTMVYAIANVIAIVAGLVVSGGIRAGNSLVSDQNAAHASGLSQCVCKSLKRAILSCNIVSSVCDE